MTLAELRRHLSGQAIRVAVSDCLLGHEVRWNGEHNGDVWPRRRVENLFSLVGICPEVGIGMGVPRHPIQLLRDADEVRVVAVDDPALDYADRLVDYAREVEPTLNTVHGYIFADRSPSCGLAGVKVFRPDGSYRRIGRGAYATAVTSSYPDLPVVDAETLNDEGVLLDFAIAVATRAGGAGIGDGPLRALVGELPARRTSDRQGAP